MVAVATVTAVVPMATVTFHSLMRTMLPLRTVGLMSRCRFVLPQTGMVVMALPGVIILGGGFHRVPRVRDDQCLLVHATVAVNRRTRTASRSRWSMAVVLVSVHLLFLP